MNIEVGKYYRMRCGGATKIKAVGEIWAQGDFEDTWLIEGGYYVADINICGQDLIAEITEQEYNRIVSGNSLPVWAQSEIAYLNNKVVELAKTRDNLKAQIEQLTGNDAFDRILKRTEHEQRRFEVAKAAMQGIMASNPTGSQWCENTVGYSIQVADALLKALDTPVQQADSSDLIRDLERIQRMADEAAVKYTPHQESDLSELYHAVTELICKVQEGQP